MKHCTLCHGQKGQPLCCRAHITEHGRCIGNALCVIDRSNGYIKDCSCIGGGAGRHIGDIIEWSAVACLIVLPTWCGSWFQFCWLVNLVKFASTRVIAVPADAIAWLPCITVLVSASFECRERHGGHCRCCLWRKCWH